MTTDRLIARLRVSQENQTGLCPIVPIAGCYHCDAEWDGRRAGRRARDHAAASGHDTWRLIGHWDISCGSQATV